MSPSPLHRTMTSAGSCRSAAIAPSLESEPLRPSRRCFVVVFTNPIKQSPTTPPKSFHKFHPLPHPTAAACARVLLLPPQVIVAEPYPPPPSEALSTAPTTFVAAFAMPNTTIPNNTDLRNFLVPLGVLESVSGMRFLGAATSTELSSSTGLLDDDAKVSLDQEALRVRADARVPPLSGHWGGGAEKGNGKGNGSRRKGKQRAALTDGGGEVADPARSGSRRVFRHLCTATSCRGL